jgi:hypothetical protein
MNLKGARREVFRTIVERSENGICTISIDDLVETTNYSTAAVRSSIRYLLSTNMLSITKAPADRRRNCYLLEAYATA